MELVEDDDVETMIALYCSSGNVELVELSIELADAEPGEDFSNPDLDEVSNDIDEEGPDGDDNVYTFPLGNSTRGIVIRNDPLAYMLSVDPDAAYAFEFLEYLDIIPCYKLTTDFKSEELVVG
ncbi:hypothetical protein J1N35_015017 [Gossypium stocksii]|uniref:Uncharacterized protein n=1 Tax=Gossypium stocksii TaxID=47602 RepID=A0A9D3VX68_9ROSI|nr:hypothetical protein J1N35_015017 [Gossypium stocksii]